MADNAIKKDAESFELPLVVILSRDRDFFPFITTLVRTGVRVVTVFSLTTKRNQEHIERWRSALTQSKVSVHSSEKRLQSWILPTPAHTTPLQA
ncbi:unnamed protein product [Closterium sp. Naga37s-1]|nr:unnamed protein product [Closterium sp. Naga37s-1]